MPFLSKEKTNWKFIAIILVLAILAGGGILDYSRNAGKEISSFSQFPEIKKSEKVVKNKTAKPIPSEVKGWRTYRNEKYGFEVKYPDNWKIEDNGMYVLFYPTQEEDIYPAQISFWENQNQLPVKEWVRKKISSHAILKGEREIEDLTINGESGVKLFESARIRLPQGDMTRGWFVKESIYVAHRNFIYNLSAPFGHKYFHQMLSTFRFTKMHKNADFSSLNKDELLHKLFPNLTFTNGVANHTAEHPEYLNLHLQNSIEDYFINTQEKNLLLIVKLDGVPHAGGLYHAYLGLFDKNGNFLTPVSCYPKCDFFEDKAHFGGDLADFGFYDCKGVKYIAFASAGCPNGSCCFGKVELFRINKGNFEKIQTIDENSLAKSPSYGLKMILSGEKIIVKKVPSTSENGCPETNFKELKWNRNSCRFE